MSTITSPGPADAATTLTALRAGHRAWFWFHPNVKSAPLLVQPLQSDPSMDALRAQAATLEVPAEGALCTGLLSIGADGVATLAAPQASADHLAALARWVTAKHRKYPGLRRLHNARFLTTTLTGGVQAAHQDPALWQEVPRPVVPGTLAETAAALRDLPVGQSAWFWLAQRASGAFLAIQPATDGEAFAERVRALSRQSAVHSAIRGVLRRSPSGAIILTTESPSAGWQDRIRSLMAREPDLAVLSRARLIEMKDGAFTAVSSMEPAGPEAAPAGVGGLENTAGGGGLEDIAAVLEALQDGQRVLFWFTDQGKDGAPVLLVGEGEAIKRAARSAKGAGTQVRGQLRRSRKGWLEFRSKKAFPGFIDAIARWTAAHRPAHPALEVLRGARFIQADEDGNIIDRQRSDAAWSRVP